MRADRLIDLIALLRRHERTTAAQLAEHLGVSRRTVLRDLDALSASGVPVFAEHGRGGGFSILPGYRPETAGLTAAGGEAAATALGRGAEFRSARRKLEAVLPDDAARGVGDVAGWLLVVPEGWGRPVDPPPAVPDLAAAAARHEVVDIAYRAVGQRRRTRRVRPIGLVLAGRTWYLLAQRDDSGEQRSYRVDRVGAVTPTGRRADPGIALADAWRRARESFRERDGITVRLRVGEPFLPVVTYLASTSGRVTGTRDLGDAHHEVEVVVEHLRIATTLFAGLGDRAEILGPPELREAVAAVSRRNLERYG